MRTYYYLNHDGRIIRLTSKVKPSAKAIKPGIWTAQEFDGKGWYYPVTSEITWNRLSKLKYIGSLKISKIVGMVE